MFVLLVYSCRAGLMVLVWWGVSWGGSANCEKRGNNCTNRSNGSGSTVLAAMRAGRQILSMLINGGPAQSRHQSQSCTEFSYLRDITKLKGFTASCWKKASQSCKILTIITATTITTALGIWRDLEGPWGSKVSILAPMAGHVWELKR